MTVPDGLGAVFMNGTSPWPVGTSGALLPPDLNRLRDWINESFGLHSILVVMARPEFQAAYARADQGRGPMLAMSTQLELREVIGALRLLLGEMERRAFLPPERDQ